MNEPIDGLVESRAQAEARESAGWRVLFVFGTWALTRALVASVLPEWLDNAAKIVLDASLSAGTLWAQTPARRHGGPAFKRSDNWTRLLDVPFLLGIVLALGGLWRLLHNG